MWHGYECLNIFLFFMWHYFRFITASCGLHLRMYVRGVDLATTWHARELKSLWRWLQVLLVDSRRGMAETSGGVSTATTCFWVDGARDVVLGVLVIYASLGAVTFSLRSWLRYIVCNRIDLKLYLTFQRPNVSGLYNDSVRTAQYTLSTSVIKTKGKICCLFRVP